MPCIWLPHNKSQVFMDVMIASTQAIEAAKKGKPNPNDIKFYKALVDTGAQGTSITKKVADELGLPPIGKRKIMGVSGARDHNFYLFYVGFVLPDSSKANAGNNVIKGKVEIHNRAIEGAELIIPNSNFDVLLGMDILSIGSLAIEGNGTFSFSY